MMPASHISTLAAGFGILATLGGPLAAHLGLLSPYTAFRAFALGAFTGSLLGVGFGLWALLRSWNQPEAVGRQWAWAGLLGGAALLLAIALAGASASKVPPIHDITTDTDNPPGFVAILPLRRNAPNPAEYGGPEIAAQQRAAYPDVQPVTLNVPPDQAFERALTAARARGWEIVEANSTAGRIEATDTTLWFGFKDDVVIRITPGDGGSRIDVRSVSRVGRSDAGTNARRIQNFLHQLKNL